MAIFSPSPEPIIRTSPTVLRGQLIEDYGRQVEDLHKTGQANDRMFTEAQIVKALTHDALARALQIPKLGKGVTPKGLLVPDNDRRAKIAAINKNKVEGQEVDAEFLHPDSKNLWNAGHEWPQQGHWRYMIVQGEPEVATHQFASGTNYERAKSWVHVIGDARLNVLEGADPYLALKRQSLVEGARIDVKNFTILNARNLKKDWPPSELSPLVARGHSCGPNWVVLDVDGVEFENVNLRARAAIELDVPKA